MSVTLTDKAISKIKALYTQDPSLAGKPFRISAKDGGCSDCSYDFKFEEAVSAADEKQEFDGFKVVIDPESNKLISGSLVDYKDESGAEGFSVQSPHVKKSCGC